MTINSSPGSSPDFTVALFYRPPSSSPALLDTLFFALCNNFVSSSPSFFLVGDFNIDFLVPCTSVLSGIAVPIPRNPACPSLWLYVTQSEP